MNTERKPYCVNQIMKGEIIFERGSEAAYVGLVLKGRVRIQAEGVNLVIGSGHFLGLTDLQDGIHALAVVYHTLEEQAERDYEFLQEQYKSYQVIGQELGITTD